MIENKIDEEEEGEGRERTGTVMGPDTALRGGGLSS